MLTCTVSQAALVALNVDEPGNTSQSLARDVAGFSNQRCTRVSLPVGSGLTSRASVSVGSGLFEGLHEGGLQG